MAQQQRNQNFNQAKAEHYNGGPQPSEQKAPVALPLAMWSNMANLQHDFLSSIVEASDETMQKVEQDAQSAGLRPDGAMQAVKVERGFLRTAAEYQREIAMFLKTRLAKNQSWLSEAGQTSDMPHFFELQTQWLADAIRDYSAEYGKLAKIVSRKS
jgi:hypothetical protein